MTAHNPFIDQEGYERSLAFVADHAWAMTLPLWQVVKLLRLVTALTSWSTVA